MTEDGSDIAASDDDVASAVYSLAAATVRRMPRDLSVTAVATLSALERLGPQRLTHLASLGGVTQPSMTALVTKLEREGLAVRRPDPGDGRGVLVDLTDAGASYLRRRRQNGATVLAELIAQLPADQARALRVALPAVTALCDLGHGDADVGPKLTPSGVGGGR